jgi:hypothetical protein
MSSRLKCVVLAVSLLVGVSAAGAGALAAVYGPPAALRVVRRTLSHEAHVAGVLWHQHGGFYDCPHGKSYPRQIPAGRAPRGCRPAAITFRQNLSHGNLVAEITTITASGFPDETFVDNSGGRWIRYGRRACWQRVGPGIRPGPALTYDGWRVAIIAHRRGVILLRSTSTAGTEIDTIDARTYALRRARTWQPIRGRGISRTNSTFQNLSRQFHLPALSPTC